ncbi:MAG: 1-deoxy-D-xylulose-5-phosphate reductoisomerase [Elusimicrobiota bacterium]|jgi:1-deoxy-D-xylulose-5-phosphate reductoisomerase|nr:1-deoxy-D-xylulose-5-phosphate reductoisomerase [Elusimicrobiota bacterium]
MKRIIVLGSSGSIGVQTLDIADKMKKTVSVEGLSVNSNIELLKKQIKQFNPKAVCVQCLTAADALKKWIKSNKLKIKVFEGNAGLEKLVSMKGADTIVSAVVGAAGLKPVIKAIESGKNIALANKEALVMAGSAIMALAKKKGVSILPVDSEHSAIFQCCTGEKMTKIKRILLTASGGPFYRYDKDFSKITVEQALAHPTWKMGKKITIDSATLMNKGLEAIEASVLFGIAIDKIEIVIHPQSIVHSMVEYIDGSVIAQLSNPDMRLPIQYALTYPERTNSNIESLDLTKAGKLEFYKPKFNKFPCLKIALDAAKKGRAVPAVMSAANEKAVEAFLSKKILFTDIAKIISKTISAFNANTKCSIDDIVLADTWARSYAESLI